MAKSRFEHILDIFYGTTVSINPDQDYPAEQSSGLTLLNLESPAISASAPKISEVPFDLVPKGLPSTGVEVIDFTAARNQRLERRADVDLLRRYARNSTWVRAAIDYRREKIGRAHPELIPIDSTRKPSRIDKRVRAEVEKLLRKPNPAGESYGQLKEQMLEDYYVVGHGCLELDLYNDTTVAAIRAIDSAKIGFSKSWDGTDASKPRFAEFVDKYTGKVSRYLANEQLMCMVNRPRSETRLGLSHVEILHLTVTALLTGDEFLLDQLVNPVSEKLISLGEGVTPSQVESFKFQIRSVKDKLAVIGGAKDPKVINLSGSAEELKILDGQTWFVRQVAAVFNISTAKLKLAVDTSRANTSEMMNDDLEALEGDINRMVELENSALIDRWSYLGDINLQFSYPILHRKDETQQARIAKLQVGQSWATINEARQRTGEKALDTNHFPFADEILMTSNGEQIPYSLWVKQMEYLAANIGKTPEPTPAADPANAADPAGSTGDNGDTAADDTAEQ